ncbi:hypothetical protein PtB15_3B362 [Puccinia triticina]|nr:hypothetical protein PtB15_3B362 [Puccinia triticina]
MPSHSFTLRFSIRFPPPPSSTNLPWTSALTLPCSPPSASSSCLTQHACASRPISSLKTLAGFPPPTAST